MATSTTAATAPAPGDDLSADDLVTNIGDMQRRKALGNDPLSGLYYVAINNPLLKRELALARNYENFEKNVSVEGDQMREHDVHYEYIEYVASLRPSGSDLDVSSIGDISDSLINLSEHNMGAYPNMTKVFYKDSDNVLHSNTFTINDAVSKSRFEFGGRECKTELNFTVLLKRLEDAMMARVECDENCDKLEVKDVECPTGLESLFVDAAYEHVWFWDSVKKCYYKIENGARVEYGDLVHNIQNCYQTYLNGDKEQCKAIYACLLDNNPDSLLKCLKNLKDENALGTLFNVSKKEISNIPPHTVRKLMKKLGIKVYYKTDSQGNKYRLPQTYEAWRGPLNSKNEVVNDKNMYKELIDANCGLDKYIKALIQVVTENPVIINDKLPSGKDFQSHSSRYGSAVGIKRFELPQVSAKEAKRVIRREELESLASHFMNRGVPNVYSMPQNVVIATESRDMLMGGGGIANAGLKDGSGNMFETIFRNLGDGLAAMGVTLNSEDSKKIESAIEQINKREVQLAELFKRLAVAHQMGEAFGASTMLKEKSQEKVLDSSDLSSVESVRSFMEEHIKKLRSAYHDMYNNTNLLSSHLLGVFGKIAVKCCDDKNSNTPPPIPDKVEYHDLDYTECPEDAKN